jgi:hypothetical protein
MPNIRCPRCGHKKSWVIRRNKRKCTLCKYEWLPQKLPLQISRSEWQLLIQYFLENETVKSIVKKMILGRGQVLRAFGIIRTVMSLDTPGELTAIFSGSQSTEKVFIGHFESYYLKNRKIFTSSNPIAGLNGVCALVCHNERVWGRLISGQTGKDLEKIMNESAGETIPWSPVLDRYTAVITKTRLYYFNHEGKSEGFIPQIVCHSIWVDLKILIAAKHGIRRERLPLYIGEVIWRHNFDKLNTISQRKRILSLIQSREYKIEGKSLIPDNGLSVNHFRSNNLSM